ncbi:MAG: type II toxin-antitoxin system VapC family toxin [Chloroflexota bacterium]
MVDVFIDTNIAVDLLRGYQPAAQWVNALGNVNVGICSIVYMEIVQGAPNKAKLQIATRFLLQFEIITLTDADQQWAMRQLTKFNLSHNVDLTDALIAAPAHRLNLPLYTRNTKHFLPTIPNLVTKPYG